MSGKALLQQISTTKLFSHWMGCIILRAVCRKNKACIVSFSYQIFKSSKFDHRKNKAFLHGVILFYLCLFVIEVSVDLIHLESVFFFWNLLPWILLYRNLLLARPHSQGPLVSSLFEEE